MARAQFTFETDDLVLRQAQRVAAARKTTVESMLAAAIEAVARLDGAIDSDLPPLTRSALGLVAGLPDRPLDELLSEALEARYGGR